MSGIAQTLAKDRPTPDPSQEGSRRSAASYQFPFWEGLGVGSRSQSAQKMTGSLRAPMRSETFGFSPSPWHRNCNTLSNQACFKFEGGLSDQRLGKKDESDKVQVVLAT